MTNIQKYRLSKVKPFVFTENKGLCLDDEFTRTITSIMEQSHLPFIANFDECTVRFMLSNQKPTPRMFTSSL